MIDVALGCSMVCAVGVLVGVPDDTNVTVGDSGAVGNGSEVAVFEGFTNCGAQLMRRRHDKNNGNCLMDIVFILSISAPSAQSLHYKVDSNHLTKKAERAVPQEKLLLPHLLFCQCTNLRTY
jgi:hypothetical protein